MKDHYCVIIRTGEYSTSLSYRAAKSSKHMISTYNHKILTHLAKAIQILTILDIMCYVKKKKKRGKQKKNESMTFALHNYEFVLLKSLSRDQRFKIGIISSRADLTIHKARSVEPYLIWASATPLIVTWPPCSRDVWSFVVIEGRSFRHVLYLLRPGRI